MKTYILNNGAYQVQDTSALKIGEMYKAYDMHNIGKDGKPTLKLVKIEALDITEIVPNMFVGGLCTLCAIQAQSNILSYELCAFNMRKTDMTQATITRQLSNEPMSIGVWEQSNGLKDNNGKIQKRRVYFVLEHGTTLKDNEITRIKGVYFDDSEQEKAYIKALTDKGYYFVEKKSA